MAEKRPNRVLGPYHDDFWAYCREGELRLQKCNACGYISWPATEACFDCAAEGDFTWEKFSGRGKIISWCTFEREYYRGILPVPWDTILVKLDEGPIFLSNPRGFAYKDIEAGMPVKLAFIDCEDNVGEFRLPVFERA